MGTGIGKGYKEVCEEERGPMGPRMDGFGNTKTTKGLSLPLPITLWGPLSVLLPKEDLLGSADDI